MLAIEINNNDAAMIMALSVLFVVMTAISSWLTVKLAKEKYRLQRALAEREKVHWVSMQIKLIAAVDEAVTTKGWVGLELSKNLPPYRIRAKETDTLTPQQAVLDWVRKKQKDCERLD